MARRALPLLVLLTVAAALALAVTPVYASAAADGGGDEDVDELGLGGRGGVTRRWLQDVSNGTAPANATNYISYGALSADTVPCSIVGASYYNCRPGGEANPYGRGCSAIAQCRD